jgi:hypothetical protein
MLTITITPRAVILAALLALAGVLAFYATDARGSATSDVYIQGDTDCDGDVDTTDALNDLRYTAGLTVGPFTTCPAVGSEGAIPGPQGPQGDTGPQGPVGPPGLADIEIITEDSFSGSSQTRTQIADCPQGKTVIAGGARITSAGSEEGIALLESWPVGDMSGWYTVAQEVTPTAANWTLRAFAICATVVP